MNTVNGHCKHWECLYRVMGAVYLVQKGHLLPCCEHCECWYRVVRGTVNAVNVGRDVVLSAKRSSTLIL